MKLQEVDDSAPSVMRRGIEARGDQVHHLAAHGHLLGDELGGHSRSARSRTPRAARGIRRRGPRPRNCASRMSRDARHGSRAFAPASPGSLDRHNHATPARPAHPICGGSSRHTRSAPRGQTDVPDPAGGLRGRNRCEAIGAVSLAYGTCMASAAIAEQHVAALLEGHAERLTDQQRLESGAIDEEVPLDFARLRACRDCECRRSSRDSRAARPPAYDARPAFRSNALCRKAANLPASR